METMKRSLSIIRDSRIYGNPQVSKYKPFSLKIFYNKNLLIWLLKYQHEHLLDT